MHLIDSDKVSAQALDAGGVVNFLIQNNFKCQE